MLSAPRKRGFSLIELMVAIAVTAILVMIAVPSFQGAALTSQLRSMSNALVSGARLARSEAIKRNAVVTLCQSSDGASCTNSGAWEQGWIVACRTDDNANCRTAGANWLVIQREPAASSGMRVITTAGIAQLSFQPTGFGASTATFNVCRESPLGNQERVISINASGQVSTRKTTLGVCS